MLSKNFIYNVSFPCNSYRCLRDLYHEESVLSLMFLIKALLIKKHVTLFGSLLKRNNFPSRAYICIYSVFRWGDIIKNAKSGNQDIKGEERVTTQGMPIEGDSHFL